MPEDQFSKAQIESILKQLEEGVSEDALCRQHRISLNMLYHWKARYGGTESLLQRLEQLEEENYNLKGQLANIEIQRQAQDTGDADHIYRILAANIPGTAITILDREERYLLAEGDFLATMGYVKESMPGKKIAEVISPENYTNYYQAVIQRAFAGETILTERQTLSMYYTLMKVVPLRNGQGDIFAIMFVLIDVTQIHQARMELARINEALELKVKERTAQLEEANRQLEAFTYSISHDLRAPLRSISGFAKIMKEDYSGKVSDEEFDQLADRVINNAIRMEKMINDLLDFSRFENKALSKSRIDMNALVQEILNELTANEPSRKVELHVAHLEPAYGDLSLLRQVWVNLLSNAFKYTRKKELARIEIGCTAEDKTVSYFVSDNGAGFDMKFADNLFGIFKRLHRAADFEGTGVGLALVRNIVQRHGGSIRAEAEVDKGASFYFTLPVDGPAGDAKSI